MTANEYGNKPIKIGFSHDIRGVALWVPDEEGKPKPVFLVEPEFAREIAMNLTLESLAVDELRKAQGENIGGGG